MIEGRRPDRDVTGLGRVRRNRLQLVPHDCGHRRTRIDRVTEPLERAEREAVAPVVILDLPGRIRLPAGHPRAAVGFGFRSEEHTSELQSLMRISYAVFCLKNNNYK